MLAFTFAVAAVNAVPALKGIWQTITLADGTETRAELCGDEFLFYWQTEDGRQFVCNEATGLYEPADMQKLLSRATELRQVSQKPVIRRAAKANLGTPTTEFKGTKKGLIILVQFSDLSFEDGHTLDLYKRIVNEEGFTSDDGFVGSVRDYFIAQSYGQFEIDFDVLGPVTMPNGYAYYGKDTNGTTVNPTGIAEMISTACTEADDEVDFNDYDWNSDGEADLVFFLFAGQGQASGGSSDTIWPHMSTYSSMSGGKTLTLDGVTIDTYACSCELSKYGIDGIGTICHEFSHCFGLPDMYDLRGSGYNYAMGNWDVLCYGNYNGNTYGDGFIPAGYTSYERWFAGWLEPTVLNEDCTVENMQALVDEPEAYIIYNDRVKTEYYMLENREKKSWDAGLAGKGMLILHVNYNKTAWENNDVNTTSQRYTIFAANNRYSSTYESGHPYPLGSQTALTNTTTPASTLVNTNADGTYYMNKPITGITRNSGDGTISFTFANENEYEKDPSVPDSYVFYESFDLCPGTGGNDGVFTGSTISSMSLAGYTDNEPWTSTMAFAAYKCAFFGNTIIAGDVISPEITVSDNCRLIFKAAPYTGDGNTLNISVFEGDVTLSDTSFALSDEEWTTFSTDITGSGTFRLHFATDKGRFFLDEVYVTYEEATGIEDVKTSASSAGDTRVYSIDGRCVGNDLNAIKDRKGIFITGGKKYVK